MTPFPLTRIIPLFLLGAVMSAPAALKVYPDIVTLNSTSARQIIVVQQTLPDGSMVELTGQAKVELPENSAAKWDATTSTLVPVSDGETTAIVHAGCEMVQVPVKVKNAATPRPVSFRLDVEPIFMRAGCNTGSCHGSARGQDGFRLSLFGFDPAGDYFRLTREYVGRRIDLQFPGQSLVLEKATGVVTHTGGELFKPDSPHYQVLRDWIAAGAKDDPEGTPVATGIRVLPEKMILRADAKAPPAHRTVVLADYSDGSVRDITNLALYLTNNEGTLGIDKTGKVTARTSGGAWVFARFDKFTAGSEVIVLPNSQEFAWPEMVKPANYIDEAVFARLKQLQIPPSSAAGDAAFLRRVKLDLSALPPTEEEQKSFAEDTAPDKRAKLIDKLVASPEFTDLWTMKWGEILQVRTNNQNNADSGRPRKAAFRYYQWLRGQIAANRPFNEIVGDLLRGEGSNLTNPPANYYTTAFGNPRKPFERAEDAAQLFLGTRIQCAQCHNHPFDRWTMDDYYGFTAFFSGVSSKRGAMPTEIYIFNNNSRTTAEHPLDGRQVSPKFLGGEEPALEGNDPRQSLAAWLTSPDNKRFARNLANRAWSQFFGRGIIEPVDDGRISNPPSNEALLGVLADRLVQSKFDIRSLVRDICKSSTYQLSSTTVPGNESDDRYFSHSMVRRLQAEVLVDAIGAVTGAPSTFNGQPQGTRAVQIFDGGADRDYFLKQFGASKRETVCACEVRMEPTLTQTLHLINGSTTDQALQRSPLLTELSGSSASPEDAIRKLYRRALGREATGYELARFCERAKDLDLKDKTKTRRFYEDVLWALLNSTEFAFNHEAMRLSIFTILTGSVSIAFAAPTYNDDILAVFKNNCTGCHNPDKLKADLDLTTYAAAMKGGSSGAAVKAGSPDSSLIYRVTMHLEEPEMPPKKPKLADAQLNLIKEWIAGGALETKGGAPAKSRDDALAMALPASDAKADGPPPMPENLPAAANPEVFSRPAPVIALAASPRAPLAAVSSHAQILLYNTETKALIGALPFPERQPNVLHFSRDGSLLLAAGGRGAHSGKAVVFDIKTGQRVAEAGTEASDAILAADLSPDRSLIATGGGDKLVRLYSTKDGKLQRTIKKHTDWVTALAFSPDGEKLATADRNGGLHLWDPRTGTILYTLSEHQARITSLAWRGDSLILASAGDDGKLILWDTAEGWAAKSMTPADGSKKDRPGRKTVLLKVPGVLSAAFAPDGRLAVTCRDNAVRVYNTNSNAVAVIKDLPEIPTAAVFTKPNGQLLTGDFRGVLQLWDFQEKQKTAVPAGELGK